MMSTDFQTSNLSKIKPKLRTQGRISGNFGKAKVKSGSSLKEIGMTNCEVVNLTTQDEYLNRMIDAYQKTTDPNLKKFIYEEVRKIKIQRGVWSK
jgi:hypothetical protein